MFLNYYNFKVDLILLLLVYYNISAVLLTIIKLKYLKKKILFKNIHHTINK